MHRVRHAEEEGALSVREARAKYFEAWGFGDGGYEATWVALKPIAGVPIGFPNTDARRRAVKLHDIHHVLTGYRADWTGEAEIAAWELGAGCGGHLAAWILNLLALQYGVFIAPSAVVTAFARGRRSASLYDRRELDDALLDERLAEVRARLHIPERVDIHPSDIALLAITWLTGATVMATPLIALLALLQ